MNHTWGTELRFVGEGFAEGRTFQAWFRLRPGKLTPAGEFIGTGTVPMTCNLQSAVLRDQVVEVVITDSRGATVLSSTL